MSKIRSTKNVRPASPVHPIAAPPVDARIVGDTDGAHPMGDDDAEGPIPSEDPDEAAADADEDDSPSQEAGAVSYYGTDFDVHGLVRRLNARDIIVPYFDPVIGAESAIPGFQRKFVWKQKQMDRFVESLLLGYPVPSIFLVSQPDKKLLVLDGQQRLHTLQKYYPPAGDLSGDGFALSEVGAEFVGLSYRKLAEMQRRGLDDTFIHAIVIKYEPGTGGETGVFQLFERLNSGGTKLHAHEIRVALYHGEMVRLVRAMNDLPSWRELYGARSINLRDQELILRFLAFRYSNVEYRRPMREFLNSFLREHRNLEGLDKAEIVRTFSKCCDLIAKARGRAAFRPSRALNAAYAEAILLGVSYAVDAGVVLTNVKIKKSMHSLLVDEKFVETLIRATADEENVRLRNSKATAAFGG